VKKRKKEGGEKFQNIPNSYESRLAVINVFDTHLKRNPTPKEITHYSKLENEQDILKQVTKDFSKTKKKKHELFTEMKEEDELKNNDKSSSSRGKKENIKNKTKRKNEVIDDSDSDSESEDDSDIDEDNEEINISTESHKSVSKEDLVKMKTNLSETLKLIDLHV
jgi:hypothetical protein